MIAVDSSVWIAHFRNTTWPQVTLLRSLFGREPLLVGDIVLLGFYVAHLMSGMPHV